MHAMSTKSREVIYSSRIRGAKIRAEGARERAVEVAREADRAEAESTVDTDGRQWRARAALAYHRAMPQRRIRLARSRMPPLKTTREHPA
jgi:hypothetical protein